MDLLANYDSDASSEGEIPKGVAEAGTRGGSLLADSPPASTTDPFHVPPPRRTKKRATFTLPIIAVPDSSDEEDDKPTKKARLDPRGKRLGEVLPAPKNTSVLGGGGSARLLSGDGDKSDDEFKSVPPTGDGVLGGPDAYAAGNEAFRIGDRAEAGLADYDGAAAQAGSHADHITPGENGLGNLGQNGAAQHGAANARHPSHAAPPAYEDLQRGGPAEPHGEDLLQAAMSADARGAARRNAADPFADLGVKFVEVKQEKLKYVNPMVKEAANAARTAFGADYEARLRQEAGAQPDKLSRRKHQISSLFHQAKMKELEMLERRSQGMKTKAETQAKYGW